MSIEVEDLQREAKYWKDMYSSVEKEFNVLADTNEELTRIILENGIKKGDTENGK